MQLKKEQAKSHRDQRIGQLFLENAFKLEKVHKTYCSNHPKAVQIMDKHKDALQDYMESKGARQPGILVLIVALSQPFRRLEKYPTMLLELERHIEENHKDRGDLQRSIEYYKQIDVSCTPKYSWIDAGWLFAYAKFVIVFMSRRCVAPHGSRRRWSWKY